MNTVKKLLDLLTPHERKRTALLLVMILCMAILDMVGIASVMPFMAVLGSPDLVQNNAFLNTAYKRLGFTDPNEFLFALGTLVVVLLLLSLAFKALTTYAQLKFILMREYSISKRLLEGYLHQPYSWFLSRHSADLGKSILSEVDKIIYYAVNPMIILVAQSAVVVALLSLLIIVEPKLSLIVGITLAIVYTLIFKVSRGYLARIGAERVEANQRRFMAVNEAFASPKEVKVGGLEQAFINRFSAPALAYAQSQATMQIIAQVPRFALEAIAFGGMLLVVLYLMAMNGNLVSALPTISLYALAGYRLMPALQQIYGAVTQIRFADAALDSLHADLMNLRIVSSNSMMGNITLKRAIILDNINYSYPNTSEQAISNLHLNIPAKSIVGLVGTTGSGKTTIIDLILGLLEAQRGFITVDDQVITKQNCRAWQSLIGYVPQQIYIADDTVKANIAFGVDVNKIDDDAVIRAAEIANLHDLVVNTLPKQYKTRLGERGVRLSGGQRQRIGIARALYHNPQLLILDEATSALDNLTEKIVMNAVHNIAGKITVIIIAHRLSTIKNCDCIYMIEKGEMKAKGTYNELVKTNKLFRTMVNNNIKELSVELNAKMK